MSEVMPCTLSKNRRMYLVIAVSKIRLTDTAFINDLLFEKVGFLHCYWMLCLFIAHGELEPNFWSVLPLYTKQ